MAYSIIQNTFTLGEMDPKLLSRVDFEGYYKTARKLRNVCVIPQGGAKRRFGTLEVSAIYDREGTFNPLYFTDSTYLLICDFLYSAEKTFTLVVRPTIPTPIDPAGDVSIDIFLNDVYQTTIDASPPYTVAQIPAINFCRAPDRILMLHEDVRPQMIQRNGADNVWTITDQPFEFYPNFDFTVIDNSGGYAAINFTPSATTGTITITASAAIFNTNHVGGILRCFGSNTGVVRITAVASTTSATGLVVDDFTNTNSVPGSRSLLTEPLYGNGGGAVGTNPARGWPTVGGFFQGRLIYGAPKMVPNAVSFSVPADYENWDDSEAGQDNGFTQVLTADGYQKVLAVVGSKALAIITNASVFTTNALADAPVSVGTTFFTEQTREGMAPLTTQVIDDQILFVENNRRSVKSFVYDIIQSSFQAESASILSPQVINAPVESATYVNPLQDDGNFYLLVNGDGTLAVFQTDKGQLVRAWTLSSTQGYFRDITSVKDKCHVLVERGAYDAASLNTPDNVDRVTAPFNYFEPLRAGLELGTSYPIFVEDGDYLVIGHLSPYFLLYVGIDNLPLFAPLPVFEYLNNQGLWQGFTPTDTTNGFQNPGTISWAEQDVSEWLPQSLNETDRKFWIRIKRTAPTQDDAVNVPPSLSHVYVNIENRMYLETITFSEVMDAVRNVTTDANGNISNLWDITGQQVWVTRLGVPHGPYFVNNNGMVSMGQDYANLDVKLGFDFKPLIIPAPPTVGTQQGVNVYNPKLIKAMFLDYYESAGLTVRGQEIPRMRIGNASVDIPLIPETDVYEVPTFSGRNPRVEIEISQYQPLPFTLIGIGYKVDM